MADNEQKALQLMAEAEKKLKSPGFFGGLLGGGARLDEACELYARAANMFKMAKKWSAAGNAFCQSAQLQQKQGNRHEAASCFVDGGNCYKKSEPQKAVDCLMKAIEIYTDMGRFTMAAKHHMSIAEIYEGELADLDKAMTHYEQAGDYYRGEESNSSANKCLVQVAKYAGQIEKYDKAIEIYEQVAISSLDSSLLKYSAKDYFFRAALCHLCVDALNAVHALAKYDELCPSFADSRESKLVKTLAQKVEEQDPEGFTQAVNDYDIISRLDQWHTTLLLRVKKTMVDCIDLR